MVSYLILSSTYSHCRIVEFFLVPLCCFKTNRKYFIAIETVYSSGTAKKMVFKIHNSSVYGSGGFLECLDSCLSILYYVRSSSKDT